MNVIITGSNGFSGYYLSQFIRTNNLAVSIIGVDIDNENKNSFVDVYSSKNNLDDLVCFVNNRDEQCKIFHLAGLTGRKPFSELIHTNVCWTSRYIEFAMKIKKLICFINIGSSAEYGLQKTQCVSEGNIPNPVNDYGISKHLQTLLVLSINNSNFNIICTRTFNILGPGLSDNFVIGKIIREFIRVRNQNDKIIDIGRLDSVRDFIDVRDLAKVYWMISENLSNKEIINVASGKGYKLTNLFDLCSKYFGFIPDFAGKEIKIDPEDINAQYSDITKLEKLLNVKEFYNIETTLKDMIENQIGNF